jgi:hypothetical protein
VLLCLGIIEIIGSLWGLRRWHRHASRRYVPEPQLQMGIWVALLVAALAAWFATSPRLALVLLLGAQILPRRRKCLSPAPDEEAELPSAV